MAAVQKKKENSEVNKGMAEGEEEKGHGNTPTMPVADKPKVPPAAASTCALVKKQSKIKQ